jgi:hypothetical protein
VKRNFVIRFSRRLLQHGVIGLLLFTACDTVRPVTPTPIDPGRQLPTPAISPQIEGVTLTPSTSRQSNGALTVVGADQEAVASPTPPGGAVATATPQTTITTTLIVTANQAVELSITVSATTP